MKYRAGRTKRPRRRLVREPSTPAPPALVTTSLRLRSDIRAQIDQIARRERRSLSDVVERLLDEGIRLRECPGIYFADEPGGRVAKVMGTGLGVWELMRDLLEVEQSEDRLREMFPHLGAQQITAARNYYLRFRDEVDREITENRELSPEVLVERYPGLVKAFPFNG